MNDDQNQQQPQQPQYTPQQQPQQVQPPQQDGQAGQRLKIDDNLLHDVGLGQLPPEEKNRLLAQIYETLELRVGMTLANQMTKEQLQEFEGFINSNDERGALTWLESNFPSYKDVVAQELQNLKTEIQANANEILKAVNEVPVEQSQPNPYPDPAQVQPPSQQPQQPPYDPNQQQ